MDKRVCMYIERLHGAVPVRLATTYFSASNWKDVIERVTDILDDPYPLVDVQITIRCLPSVSNDSDIQPYP